MKDDLVAVVSHDLRNPIGVIRGYTELMATDPDLPDTLRHDLAIVDRTSGRLTNLVDDLLGLAVTKAIVEAHGGTITAEPGTGCGTRFTVTLPA